MESDLVAEVKSSVSEQRELKSGDWIVLNTKLEYDVSAQIGVVVDKLDSGIINVALHSLGVQIELHQENLSHASDRDIPEALKRARLACGGHDGSCNAMDGKRHKSDPQSYLPAHIPPLYGRGAEVRREVLKAVRRELLSMEENIGWEKVDKTWKSRRTPWIKGLRSPEVDCSEVALLAGAMADLHEALKTDKLQGLFKRNGSWEVRLCELASSEGANNYQALALVWGEMREGVHKWLEGGSLIMLDEEGQGRPESKKNHNNNVHQGVPPGLSQSAIDRLVTASSQRAIAALESASLHGADYVDQVPLDRILAPLTGEGSSMIRSLIEQEKEEIKAKVRDQAAARARGGDPTAENAPPSKPRLQLEAILSSRQPEGSILVPLGDVDGDGGPGDAEETDVD